MTYECRSNCLGQMGQIEAIYKIFPIELYRKNYKNDPDLPHLPQANDTDLLIQVERCGYDG